ncbi:MAG: hypothetical protein FWF92_01725 [Oscillospiraceae bacterium]|nr:hypothetical protein [Oscillospiraceae bacterium]
MVKKFSAVFTVMLLIIFVLTQTVMAVVLEVDTASPEFKSDTWQNNEGNDEVFPISMAFSTTPTRGVPNDEVERFCANVQDGAADMEGEVSILNGSAVNNAVFPFKETVRIDSVTWKWNNGGRQYFFLLYTSMDGQNWTEIEITGNAVKTAVENTYDETGDLDGPGVECYVSTPAGSTDDDDVNPITFTFNQTPDAKYFKIVMFGNDGESGDMAVSHPWVSFNSLVFEGVIATEESAGPAAVDTPAADVPAPAPADNTPAPAPAPPSGDTGTIILICVLIIAAAGVVILRKKIAVK